MNLKIFVSLVFVLCLSLAAFGQVPAEVHVRILKAEDARRWDAELEKLISGNAAEPVVVRAMLAAGRIGDERAVPVLSQRLRSGSPAVAAMAAFALGEIESIAAADAILQRIGETGKAQLPGGNASVNERGDRAAEGSAATRPIATLPDGRVSARLVEAAGKIAAANAKHEKAKQLGDAIVFVLAAEKERPTSVETARLALTAALRARPAGAEENVRFFLSHTDPNVVADALNTLARLRAKNANRDARDLLETNTHAVVRANAARVLAAGEDKEAVDLLVKAATSDADSRVRISAIRSLAALKDAKSADKLLTRGEAVLAEMTKTRKPNFIPSEQSEFLEICTALGQILAKTGNARAIALFRDFAKTDNFNTAEPYIARVRVGAIRPGAGLGDNAPPPTELRQFITLVQAIGELSAYEPESEEARKIKTEAPVQARNLLTAFLAGDPQLGAAAIVAAPDALRAFARFKTDDLAQVLRDSLKNKDIFVRATAAELIAELPKSDENLAALHSAFDLAILDDINYNDAILAILDALIKLDKDGEESVKRIARGIVSPDHLVRQKVRDALPAQIRKVTSDELLYQVNAPVGPGTRMGQILNKDADYRRAIARKNGSVRAVFTTQKGAFTIDLLPEDAPLTVDNFVKLARSGYFNGLEVHRVVPNFVMQDGDPRGDGNGGPGWSIRCEMNTVPFERGAVGMALSGKDTGGSQWFVTHSPQPHLDGGYTVFGRVNEKDMAVVDKIVRGDKIVSVRIVEGKAVPRPAKRK